MHFFSFKTQNRAVWLAMTRDVGCAMLPCFLKSLCGAIKCASGTQRDRAYKNKLRLAVGDTSQSQMNPERLKNLKNLKIP